MYAAGNVVHSLEIPVRRPAPTTAPETGEPDIRPFVEPFDAVPEDAPLRSAIEMFRAFPETRFLAVIDPAGQPVGAVHERLVRDLLFSPFGHSLLDNPGSFWRLSDYISPCPVADAETSIEKLLEAFAASEAEGVIVTRGGRYVGLLPGQAILQLAGRRERALHRRKLAEAQAAVERNRKLNAAVDLFQADAVRFGADLLLAANEIKASAEDIVDRARANGQHAVAAAAAAAQSADGVSEVAASSNALADQVKGIEAQFIEAKNAVRHALGEVQLAEGKSKALAIAADEIGGVVSLISSIAGRVNMLSINATIEAARAGDAGKGFAVVASEVKALARQVGDATGQIASRIDAIRYAAAETNRTNRTIGEIVARLDDVAAYVSEAVAHQATSTAMIADNVEQAARASGTISIHVSEMRDRAETAGLLASRMQSVAAALSGRAEQLGERVDAFLREVEAA